MGQKKIFLPCESLRGRRPYRRPSPPWRASLRHGGLFWCAALLLSGGCADSGPNPISISTIQRWILRYSAPAPKTPAAAPAPKLVFIDTETLAHYHPDWRLADALAGLPQPVPPPVPSAVLPPPPEPLEPLSEPETSENKLPALTLRAGPNAALLRGEEIQAVYSCIADAQRRQSALAAQEDAIAHQALQQQITAAQRKRLLDLQPVQLSPEDQNRLTNLRLSLMRNLYRTPQERANSQAELEALLKTWSDQLRQQEAAHRAAIDEIYQRIPDQMRASGEAMIGAAAAREDEERRTQRESVESEQVGFIGQDLAAAELTLETHLQPADSPGPLAAPAWPKEIRTFSPDSTSTPPVQPLNAGLAVTAGSPSKKASNQIASLRARARSEAKAWARLAALRMGVVWSADRRYPDETKSALGALFAPPETGKARRATPASQ